MNLAVALAGSTLAVWVYLIAARGAYWQVDDGIPVAAPPTQWPKVAIVIPARNEAEHIADTVESLRRQAYPGGVTVTVVDDQSDDGTADLARAAGADVIAGLGLPKGWTGKLWALRQGVDAVSASAEPPRYVLFTDADIRWSDPQALARLVAEAEDAGLVLNSRMVRLRRESAAERALIPAFVYFFRQLYPFRWINDPANPMAGGAGGCMLLRREALLSAGGIDAIRTALIDDCAMGALMKRQGPIRLALTTGIESLRPYPAVADIRAMVVRSAYAQLHYSRLLLVACLLGLALTYIAPPLLALFARGPAQAMGAAAFALMIRSFVPIQRFYGLPIWRAATLPLIAILYGAFTLDSALQHERGRGGYWKGRAQALDGSHS
jgi:hopene-associated glycosyltransferase HpnB